MIIKNNKGLSTIVTTLILVLLVLVAVGILWNPVKNLLTSNTEAFDKTRCLTVDLKVKVNETVPGDYDVTITRSDGGEDEIGIKLVFHNATNNSAVTDFTGFIAALATETDTVTGVVQNATMLEVTPYFLDTDTNKEQLCDIREIEIN